MAYGLRAGVEKKAKLSLRYNEDILLLLANYITLEMEEDGVPKMVLNLILPNAKPETLFNCSKIPSEA